MALGTTGCRRSHTWLAQPGGMQSHCHTPIPVHSVLHCWACCHALLDHRALLDVLLVEHGLRRWCSLGFAVWELTIMAVVVAVWVATIMSVLMLGLHNAVWDITSATHW